MQNIRVLCLTGLFALAACADKPASSTTQVSNQFIFSELSLKLGGIFRVRGDTQPAAPDDNGIQYHGGSLLGLTTTTTPTVYYIWYGNWSGNTAIAILTDFANTIGGSPYFNINNSYCNAADCSVSGLPVINNVQFGASAFDNYSHGTSLTDAAVADIVATALNGGALPRDLNGVYFVLTSPDVNEVSGECTRYCGWHTHTQIQTQDIKFSYVGNPDRCPGSCEAQSGASPNDNPGADGMANIIGHELEESVTDPDINAWYDRNGQENADKCAWSFGSTYPLPNGSVANMRLGTRDFLIQRNWVNDSGGYCDLTYPGRVGPRISSFNPTQGHPGDSVTISGINFVNVSNVTVAGVPIAIFNVVSDMRIDATLPPDAGPATGPITVTTADGTGISTINYTILGPGPTISSFAPASGHPGDSIDIFGTNFVQFISGEAVTIAGLNASYVSVDPTHIVATVPGGGGRTGPITVTTQGGSATSASNFTFLGRFTATGNLNTGRANHTAVLLTTGAHAGNVLVVGGRLSGVPTATAELFDPGSGVFTTTGSLNQARAYHTATMLADGRVLIVGGGDDTSSLNSAEIYNPSTEQFTFTSTTLNSARRGHTATTLGSGLVLIAGGLVDASTSSNSAELYDPVADTFAAAANTMSFPRSFHTGTALQDGRVLLVGGPGTAAGSAGRTAELYNPVDGTFSQAGNFPDARMNHTSVLLNDGRVLIGGLSSIGTTAMYYDPGSGTFTTFEAPGNGGTRMTATVLSDGVVLWTGGTTNPSASRLHRPSTGLTFFSATMTRGRNSHTATLLADGRVLVVGGLGTSANTAEIYDYNSP